MTIILASKSPRRKELLKQIGLRFKIMPSELEEGIGNIKNPEEVVKSLSLMKARHISTKVSKDDLIIAADTIVVYKGNILGKPVNRKDAFNMLKSLSNDIHSVFTGLTVLKHKKYINESEKTEVKFTELTDDEIWNYIDTQEPMDKAGAYGIQGLGSVFVEKINGDYFNVVGLPICRLKRILYDEFNIKII